jgi:glutathione S-transferase
MIRLYYHPLSTFSRRVWMACLEKDIPFERIELDVRGGELQSPAYLAKNPYGLMPTIEEDGFVLHESTAILEYLEARHPEPPLVPADPRGRGLCAMHIKLCDLHIGAHTRDLIWPTRFLRREKWDLAAMAAARADIQRHLDKLAPALESKTWLCGDAYTLADLCYTPFTHFFAALEIVPPAPVAEWAARLADRPSARATVPAR